MIDLGSIKFTKREPKGGDQTISAVLETSAMMRLSGLSSLTPEHEKEIHNTLAHLLMEQLYGDVRPLLKVIYQLQRENQRISTCHYPNLVYEEFTTGIAVATRPFEDLLHGYKTPN